LKKELTLIRPLPSPKIVNCDRGPPQLQVKKKEGVPKGKKENKFGNFSEKKHFALPGYKMTYRYTSRKSSLRIEPEKCIHCKSCDIKSPKMVGINLWDLPPFNGKPRLGPKTLIKPIMLRILRENFKWKGTLKVNKPSEIETKIK